MRTTSLGDAVAMIPAGASLMIGGFMGVGTPEPIIDELVRQEKRDLSVIANDTAFPGVGIGKLISAKLVRRVIASHIGLNPETQQQMLAGVYQLLKGEVDTDRSLTLEATIVILIISEIIFFTFASVLH